MSDQKNDRKRHRGGTRAEVRDLPNCIKCNREIGPGEAYEIEEDAHGQIRVWHAVRLYFDECADAIPKTLQKMGFCIEPSLPKGTPDIDWLTHAGAKGCTVITQDARIAQKPIEKQALIDNKVKCFILPARSRNVWDLVRGFVTMWDKIRVESFFPGPFIWRLNDESQPIRWEQLYPQDPGFAPFDLSRTPVGHLLNLFADIVHMHDEGWYSTAFVNGLHENIRRELEARIQRDQSLAMEPSQEWQNMLSQRLDLKLQEGVDAKLAKPFDTATMNHLMIALDNDIGLYQWIIPAHKAGDNLTDAEDVGEEMAFAFRAGPTGFHRSGFGIQFQRVKPRRKAVNNPAKSILDRIRDEFVVLGSHLEIAVSQWRRVQTLASSSNYESTEVSDLYDALRMRCIWIQEHIQVVHQIHGDFWMDFRQELVLKMNPIHQVLIYGHQVDNTELDRLAEHVIKPLCHAVKRTRFAAQDQSTGNWSATFDRETLLDFLDETQGQGKFPATSAGFAVIGMHEGAPCIFRICPQVDADGMTRQIALTSSRTVKGHVTIMGKRMPPHC